MTFQLEVLIQFLTYVPHKLDIEKMRLPVKKQYHGKPKKIGFIYTHGFLHSPPANSIIVHHHHHCSTSLSQHNIMPFDVLLLHFVTRKTGTLGMFEISTKPPIRPNLFWEVHHSAITSWLIILLNHFQIWNLVQEDGFKLLAMLPHGRIL